MKTYLTTVIFLINSLGAFAANEGLVPSKRVELVKYNNGITTLRVGVCPADAEVKVGINFTPSSSPADLTLAELEVLVPEIQCYENTYQMVQVDLNKLIKEKAIESSIQSSSILMRTLPIRIEVQQ